VRAHPGVLGRRQVAQRRVPVSLIVFLLEVTDDHAGLEQTVPVVAVEALLPQPVVERTIIEQPQQYHLKAEKTERNN
jgi:H+/Cl- antiporter ClcA